MDEYEQALLFDGFTVICCVGLLVRFADLRASHPGAAYIIFHLHTFTTRLAGLQNGAMSLYENAPGLFQAVMPSEITRAALYGDIAFWSVTLAWIVVKARPRRRIASEESVLMLEPRILRPVLFVTFLMGLVGLRYAAAVPGVPLHVFDESSAWNTSSYLIILPSWFGLAVLGYVYYYGFGRITSCLLGLYLALMAIQGGMRFRVIIGSIMAVIIWVERKDRRWPSKSLTLGLMVAAVAFFPMKAVGTLIRTGGETTELSQTVTDSVSEAADGSAGDQMFLDEFASTLTLLDMQDKRYWGSIYLPLLTLPIPRAFWPEKPTLVGFLGDISTGNRPMATSGMITTYLGEAYANFGLIGIFIVPPLLAVGLSVFMRRAYEFPRNSVFRFAYILLSVNLIQVYRDGLGSIVVFTFVNMMPLVAIVLIHVGSAYLRARRTVRIAEVPVAWRRGTSPETDVPPESVNGSGAPV